MNAIKKIVMGLAVACAAAFTPTAAMAGVSVTGANETYSVEGDTVYVFSTVGENVGTVTVSGSATADILVVGGGGAGACIIGGGGGGGGVVYLEEQVLGVGDYAITVGAGGATKTKVGGGPAPERQGGNGGDSAFATWIGKGGGGGGYYTNAAGSAGGCGGGGNGSGAGGASNQETYEGAGHGYAGYKTGSTSRGGGGGGAGAAATGQNGGDGFECGIVGTNAWYGAGGGGGTGSNISGRGVGGKGGGGSGGRNQAGSVVEAKVKPSFYGAGGGGDGAAVTAANSMGDAGYQGVVIVRVKGGGEEPPVGPTEPTVVTVTPDANQAKTVDAADPTLTYTLSPDIAVTGALAREAGETVGTYAINLGTLKAVNESAYTLQLAAETVYFSITNAVTPPTPPDEPTEPDEPTGDIEVIGADETLVDDGEMVYVFSSVGSEGKSIYFGATVTADILIVGGGGGGGGHGGCGGGAGGLIHQQDIELSAGTYAITVGAGGAGGRGSNGATAATNGGNSSFGDLVALGGGFGGAIYATPSGRAKASGGDGGSGGGAGQGGTAGTGLQPTSTSGGLGNNGGSTTATYKICGGGGAMGPGVVGPPGEGRYGVARSTAISGGAGYECAIVGTNAWYAGGGGAGNTSQVLSSRGANGGGDGGTSISGDEAGKDATTPGSGGGGAGFTLTGASWVGGSGAKGIVIVRVHAPLTRVKAAVTGYYGVYDGAAHGATVEVVYPEGGSTVRWAAFSDEPNYASEQPTYTLPGVYTNLVEVTASDLETFYGTGVVTIVERQIEATATGYSGLYDGEAHGASVTVVRPAGECTVAWKWHGEDGFTNDAPQQFTEIGTYTNVVRVSAPYAVTFEQEVEIRIVQLMDPVRADGTLKTWPWQQNVYSNRFAIMCQAKSATDGLELCWGPGYIHKTPMLPTGAGNIYKAKVTEADIPAELVGTDIPYVITLDGHPLTAEGAESADGVVKLWRDDGDFSCAIWGDNQMGTQDWSESPTLVVQRAFEHMVGRHPDFGLTSGDVANQNGLHQTYLVDLTAKLFGRTKPFYIAWGNHDGEFATREECNKYADVESTNYCLYRGNVLFMFMHWNSRGATWLENVLATPEAKQAKFRVLVVHAGLWMEVWANSMSSSLQTAAINGGVDIIFSGHMHGYERIHQSGVIQLTNGGFGYLDHNPASSMNTIAHNYGDATFMGGHNAVPYLYARQSSKGVLGSYKPVVLGRIHSYGEMTVKGNVLTYTAHGFAADGTYIGAFDNFSITSKTVAAPPVQPEPSVAPCEDPSEFADCLDDLVTNAKWKQYKDAIGEPFAYKEDHGDDPVVSVSRLEIERFIAWLNAGGGEYRLPTAIEAVQARGGVDLAGEVSEWTCDTDPERGWCRIVGGNAKAEPGLWCDPADTPAIGTPGCYANYLGFRLATGLFTIDATVSGYYANYDGLPHGASVEVDKPASGATVKWAHSADLEDFAFDAPETFTEIGSYTNVVKVMAEGYHDFYGTGVVTITERQVIATVKDVRGFAGMGSYACSLEVSDPADDYTAKWAWSADDDFTHNAPQSYDALGVYTNYVKVTADNYDDFVGTGVVTIIDAPKPGVVSAVNANETITNGEDVVYVFSTVGANSGTLTASDAALVDVLIVGGGGAGGSIIGGGGGGGGVVYLEEQVLGVGDYAITVGAGGATKTNVGVNPAPERQGGNGGDSAFATWIGKGGGGGGYYTNAAGSAGGCGGGGNGSGAGGSSNQLAYKGAGHGNAGAAATGSTNQQGGGGGGAGSAATGQNGGDGFECGIVGTNAWYGAGGGGGTGSSGGSVRGLGGKGGGGAGGRNKGNDVLQAKVKPSFYGAGGGGGDGAAVTAANSMGDAGYQGVVIVRVHNAVAPTPPEPTVVTVTPNAGQSKTVGAADPTLTYTLSEDIAVTGALARKAGEDVGTYAINLGTLVAADPTAYTLKLAAETVYFEITAGDTPEPPSVPQWMALYTEQASSDTSTKGEEIENYTAYYCTVEAAKQIFGSSEVDAVTQYLKDNYETASGLVAGAGILLDANEYGLGQYGFSKYVLTVPFSQYLGFVFYANGEADEFRVFGADNLSEKDNGLVFDDTDTGTVGDWTKSATPGIPVGEGLSATFADGVCTISGTGAMWAKAKLDDLRELAITNLIISEGVTSISEGAFANMWSIRDVTIGSTVANIGAQSFLKCYNLTNVVIHTGATAPTVGEYAFFRCNSLVRITVTGDSSVNWGENAFTLQAGIYMNSAGLPEIYPIPEIVDVNGSVMVLFGTNDLGGEWTKINSNADRANYHFFKIVIEKK